MGLDSVELLLAIEAEFGIEIDDRDAEKMTTPRKVADYLVSRIAVFEPDDVRCLSQAAFHRIRSVLVSRFAAVRADDFQRARGVLGVATLLASVRS